MADYSNDKILCVDDEQNILHLFNRTLGRKYQLYTAINGEQALQAIREHGPFAVILSDYNMPGLTGIELLKQVRTLSPDTVQVMLTGNIDLNVAIKAINEADIFRYLPKPSSTDVIAKVVNDALNQYHLIKDKQSLALELEQKNRQLTELIARLDQKKLLLEHELEMAKTIYSKVILQQDSMPEGVDYFIAAKETVGGDFILSHTSEDGQSFYLMLGDLTGHGLQSALAVLLVSELFEEMAGASPGIEELAQHINIKMCRKLPIGLFCAALLIKLDRGADGFSVWHGGLPDAYLLDVNGNILNTLSSNNLPLGVLAEQEFNGTSRHYPIGTAHSLFVYSDGVIEQAGVDETQFGEQSLKTAILETPAGSSRVSFVMSRLRSHRQGFAQSDDISLFELDLPKVMQALERR